MSPKFGEHFELIKSKTDTTSCRHAHFDQGELVYFLEKGDRQLGHETLVFVASDGWLLKLQPPEVTIYLRRI